MSRHTEGKDLMCKAIILKLLAKVAFIAVQNKQPVRPYLVRLCMRVEVLKLLKAERVVRPAVLRDGELLIARYICLLVLGREVDASFVYDERRGIRSSSADALDNCYPLAIT